MNLVPPASKIDVVARWIAAELKQARKRANSTGGRVLLRRMTRAEYANTVRDLLALEFLPKEGPLDLLPPDGSLDGLDKVSKALLLDPSLMENYFSIAEIVANKAVVTGPPPVPTKRMRMEYESISGGIAYILKARSVEVRKDGIVSMSQGMRTDQRLHHSWSGNLIPVRGTYTMRLRLGANPGARGEPLYIRVSRRGDGDLYYDTVPGTLEKPEIIEITRPFDPSGGNEIGIDFVNKTDFTRVNYYNSALRTLMNEATKSGKGRKAGRYRAEMGAEGMIGTEPAPTPTCVRRMVCHGYSLTG